MINISRILSRSLLRTPNLPQSYSTKEILWQGDVIGFLADGRCTVSLGSTSVLATVVSSSKRARDFSSFPLQVEFYGRDVKNERIARDRDTIISQKIDRAVRCLFPAGYLYDTSIQTRVLASDGTTDYEVLAINATSGALMNSDVPFLGPLGVCKVARIQDRNLVNPTIPETRIADFVLTFGGTRKGVVLLEGSGKEMTSDQLCTMMDLAQTEIIQLIEAQEDAFPVQSSAKASQLMGADSTAFYRVLELAKPLMESIFSQQLDVRLRRKAIEEAKGTVEQKLDEHGAIRSVYRRLPGSSCVSPVDLYFSFLMTEELVFKELLFNQGIRPDGLLPQDLHPAYCQVNILPAAHGSSLYRRGDTQCFSTVNIASPSGSDFFRFRTIPRRRCFVIEYSTPAYACNMISRFHRTRSEDMDAGFFIEGALSQNMPSEEDFPFSVLVDLEVTASDGSNPMVALSSATAALVNSGVPLQKLVAGVSFVSISDSQTQYFEREFRRNEQTEPPVSRKHILLADPQSVEERFSDMDFKVCGNCDGITAFQLNTSKDSEVGLETLKAALKESNSYIPKLISEIATVRVSSIASTI